MRGGGVAGVLGGKPAKVLAHRTQRRAWQRLVPKDQVAVLRCGVGEAGEDSRRRPVASEVWQPVHDGAKGLEPLQAEVGRSRRAERMVQGSARAAPCAPESESWT